MGTLVIYACLAEQAQTDGEVSVEGSQAIFSPSVLCASSTESLFGYNIQEIWW